ncbi:DDE-type integrase/transposase/recombinase, partial [Enterococcus italicus]|uniref:DDE-type integrase/transposase/recombinase n=1 Tax=Enterococcus italicus TaxID=246144 RepID=UPI003D9A7660
MSAILDLYDRRIVAYVISERNDLPLVLDTFDKARSAEPDAQPIFHSDRGFQYTNKKMYERISDAQ